MVPHELRLLSLETTQSNVDEADGPGEKILKESEHARNLLAMAVGERGAKLVNLGATEYFAFLDYYASSEAKRLERKKDK